MERNLEILSEASRRLPDEVKSEEAHIPWQEIAGIGNILRREYHQIYPAVLWDTCRKDLKPALSRAPTGPGLSPAAGVLLDNTPGGLANHFSQVDRFDELHIGAVRECELHDFLFAVESQANTYSLALVELLHDSPASVAYPAQDARIDQIRRMDLGKPTTIYATVQVLPHVLRASITDELWRKIAQYSCSLERATLRVSPDELRRIVAWGTETTFTWPGI